MTRIRYQDGKLIEELVYFDALDFQQKLGFTLTPPASTPAAASKWRRRGRRSRRGSPDS